MDLRILQIIKSQLSKELSYINCEKESLSKHIKLCYELSFPDTAEGKIYFESLNKFRNIQRELLTREKKLIEALKSIKKQINALKNNKKVKLSEIEEEFGHKIGTEFKVVDETRWGEFSEDSIVKLIKSDTQAWLLFELVSGHCIWNNAPNDKPGAYLDLVSALTALQKI